MDMLVDLKELNCDLTEIITGLIELGRKIEMEVRVHLHSERKQKKSRRKIRRLRAEYRPQAYLPPANGRSALPHVRQELGSA